MPAIKTKKRTANEVNGIVAEAIEHMRLAQPGRPSHLRSEARAKSNELMGSLTDGDLKKVTDEMLNLLSIYA